MQKIQITTINQIETNEFEQVTIEEKESSPLLQKFFLLPQKNKK